MADLTHWDFAELFSGWDAAALILGYEPRDSEDVEGKVRVVYDRMELHFQHASNAVFQEHFGDPVGLVDWDVNSSVTPLSSVKLLALLLRCLRYGEETPLLDWLKDRRQSKFENQEFSRNEIAKWLDGIGMSSRYAFRRAGVKDDATVNELPEVDPVNLAPELEAANVENDRPLATRERNTLLTIIAALCKEEKIDIGAPSKAGDLIQSMTYVMGAPVAKRTIEEHLKKIPSALEARMK